MFLFIYSQGQELSDDWFWKSQRIHVGRAGVHRVWEEWSIRQRKKPTLLLFIGNVQNLFNSFLVTKQASLCLPLKLCRTFILFSKELFQVFFDSKDCSDLIWCYRQLWSWIEVWDKSSWVWNPSKQRMMELCRSTCKHQKHRGLS